MDFPLYIIAQNATFLREARAIYDKFSRVNLSRVKIWVFDLDGVIWRGESAIEGAAPCIAALQKRGCRTMFASNNSTRTPQNFVEKLAGMSITAMSADVLTSTTVTVAHLKKQFPAGGRIFIVGEAGLRAQLEAAGFEVTQQTDGEPEKVIAVVAGLARQFCFADVARAQHYILGGATYIATNRDSTFPIEGGVMPGAGAIIAAIDVASGTIGQTMGKPEPTMLQQILNESGLPCDAVAMVGDRLDTDIACAHRAGVAGVWVATGAMTRAQAQSAQGEEIPDVLLDNLSELISQLEAE